MRYVLILFMCVIMWVYWCSPKPGQHLPQEDTYRSPRGAMWRRTVGGWERAESWLAEPSRPVTPPMHPLALALIQGLISIGALVAIPTWEARRSETATGKRSTNSRKNLRPRMFRLRTQWSAQQIEP